MEKVHILCSQLHQRKRGSRPRSRTGTVGGDECVTALSGGLPDQSDRLRQSERLQELRSTRRMRALAQLRSARRVEYPAPHHVSGQAPQSQPRDRGRGSRDELPPILNRPIRVATALILGPEHTKRLGHGQDQVLALVRPYNWALVSGPGALACRSPCSSWCRSRCSFIKASGSGASTCR